MKAFIIYCHPSDDSFTRHVRDNFIKGVVDSGNEYEISDLYKMDFKTDITESEYLRDSNYRDTPILADDVLAEQQKINSADAIVFIYPVFWTEAPAKLVGWFDRVWSYGFAYGKKTNSQKREMKTINKALILCTAGHYKSDMEKYDLLYSMKKVMLGDRLFKRVNESEFYVFDGMSKGMESREKNWDQNLTTAYEKGRQLFADTHKPFSLNDRYFVAVENSSAGEVSERTTFCYHQQDDTIWAEYSGGKIKKGFLVGTIAEDYTLHFNYQHLNTNNELKSGSCTSTLQILPNGKIRYNESWQWTNGEYGTSAIEEI